MSRSDGVAEGIVASAASRSAGGHASKLLLCLVLALRGAHEVAEQQRVRQRPDAARDRA